MEGRTAPASERVSNVDQRVAASDYWRTMAIPLRTFARTWLFRALDRDPPALP